MAWQTLYQTIAGASSSSNIYTRRCVIAASALAATANTVRVKFLYAGSGSYALSGAYIGLRALTGDVYDIDPSTMVRLTQGGSTTITVAAADTYSDQVALLVDGTRDVVISLYGSSLHYRVTTVPAGMQAFYRSGDYAGEADTSSFTQYTNSWHGFMGLEGDTILPFVPVGGVLAQGYGLFADHLGASGAQDWLLLDTAGQCALSQPWGLRMSRDLVEPWSNAPVRVAGLAQPWRDAGELARGLVQPWQDAVPLAAGLAQEWDILAPLAAGLVQPWAVAADAALVGPLAQGWDLRDVVPLSTDLAQPWTIGTDPALLRYTLTVTVDGHAVQVDSLTVEADLDQDAIACTLSLARLADYQRCRDLCPVVVRVAVNGGVAEEYHLILTSARIDERHGETRYEVQAESALVLLGEPYAQPVSVEEYTGAASVIAATLCAPLSLAWQTVDWTLPSGALVAAGETPLELLKRLAAAVGAVVQARPDGSVRVAPEYPVSLPAWARATPDLVWIETERSEQLAGQPERRAGYNKYLIGETLTAADSLRLEEETISETVKLVRGYQVPWTGLFGLVHTGGSWVQVEDLGVETRQEVETIEIVAGEGRVRYPILSRDAVRWLHTSLGALTVSEDGTVRADVAGQSLCEVMYTTRCRRWRVRDGRNESLQLVAEI